MNKSKIIVAITTCIYFAYYCFTYREWHFIDNVNLIIHEAGHTIFMPLGTFMYILGGSLFQVVFPMVFVYYFYRRREYFPMSLLLFWVGQNLINVSVYASDAIVMRLPLLGGDNVGHDWNNLLEMMGVLKHTDAIGAAIWFSGMVVISCAAYLSLSFSVSKQVSV